MTTVVPVGTLDATQIVDCCVPDPNAPLSIDLRRCIFVRPAGLVFLGVLIEAASLENRSCEVRFRENSDLAVYMERMGLRSIIDACGVATDAWPRIRHHPSRDRFVELTRFGPTGDSIIDDVCQTLTSRAIILGDDRKRLHNSVFELGVNVEQHAQSTGLVAVQHYPQLRRVEFAVGDFGVGIRGSLATAGFQFSTDSAAIRAAVETDASRLKASEPWRGQGLRSLRSQICSERLMGSLIVQSGNQRVEWAYSSTPKVSTLNYRLDGTLAFGTFTTC